MLLETSRPGVLAAGDVRSGSIKRVASAVGEGSMAVRLVHEHLTALGRDAGSDATGSDVGLVDVAPAPVLAGLERPHDRVADRVRVRRERGGWATSRSSRRART